MKRIAFLAVALVLAGCAKNIDNKEAVQEGVRKGVAKRGIDPAQMDVDVKSVSFHGNTADAVVAFSAKGAPGASGVTVNYQLERVKDEWVVKNRAPMSTHATELPPAMGAGRMPGERGSGEALPAGHPAVGGPKQ